MGLADTTEKICEKHKIKEHRPECSRCQGEGMIEDDDDLLYSKPLFVTCWSCAGHGFSPWTICEFCDEEAMEKEWDE